MKDQPAEEAGDPPVEATTTMEQQLLRATTLVNSLMSDSLSATTFVGKWQSIRTKLTHLSSGLSSAATPTINNPSPALLDLLHSITQTISETQQFLPTCSGEDPHPSGGKLLIRSNLDQVTAKLDLHIRSLSDVYASGALSAHSSAIVASRPPAGATRDEMRFYVRDLSARLDVGDLDAKTRALSSLHELIRDDDRYVKIVVSEAPGVLNSLVAFLESGDVGVRAEAAGAASALAGRDEGKVALVASGAIGSLVAAVEVGTDAGRERAARALAKLTENGDNAWAVAAHGGATALLGIVDREAGGRDIAGAACAALRNLAGVAEVRGFLVERGAVPVFLKLLRAPREETLQLHAIDFLRSVAADEPEVTRSGRSVVASLLHVLDPASGSSAKMQAAAIRAAEALCVTARGVAAGALVGSGFLERVLAALRGSEAELREAAVGAAAWLCAASSEEARRAMGEMGFMGEMVRAMEWGPAAAREVAARALAGMVKVLEEEAAAGRAATRGMLLAALAKVSECGSGRRRIAAACDVARLQGMEEGDAKKIARKISRGGGVGRCRRALLGVFGW